jgi:solute carrier family 25 phosphate transporter 23/24/25/41
MKAGGLRGWWRGNGINCLRIMPCLPAEFALFEYSKQVAMDIVRRRDQSRTSLSMGELVGLAGSCAVAINTILYPLDLLKSCVAVERGTIEF